MEICRFYTERRIIRVDELGQTFDSRLSCIKMGTRSIVRLVELPFVMRLERRTTEGYSSR